MLLASLGIILGLFLLAYGADRFVSGAASIARGLGVSPMIIGLTIVSLATSMPEMLVGSVAAFNGKTLLAIGNALGSNITNTSLVLGVTVLLMPITVASKTIRHEYTIMISSMVIALLLMLNLDLTRVDGFLLSFSVVVVAYLLIRATKNASADDPFKDELIDEIPMTHSTAKASFLFILGLLLLLGGAHLLVTNSVLIAKSFGISDLVIGLTIVAVGTSLPELAASVMSALKNEADIAVGNVIGSNIFNILIVLGIPAIINPVEFDSIVLTRDFLAMILLALLLGWMLIFNTPSKFSRMNGLVLFLCFIAYQNIIYITASQ